MSSSRRSLRCFAFVWLCGATIAPVGDHFHVARGVTEYLTDFGPIWLGNSPLWFVLLVSTFMASLALFQGKLGARTATRASDALVLASPLLVLGLYLTTSFYPWREGGSLETLVSLGALLMFLVLDRSVIGLVIGIAVAVGATFSEWGLVQLGVFRYLPESDELWGVAPWLLPLYLAASVAVGAVGRRLTRPVA
ncbi:MAG: hypothetical protein H6712_25430 [Myxococcales bacterium]|nr:hypothetical protein [Myxococcales bacterium]MCB9717217.1 hypothetical protein [Myxococcales bacterium]